MAIFMHVETFIVCIGLSAIFHTFKTCLMSQRSPETSSDSPFSLTLRPSHRLCSNSTTLCDVCHLQIFTNIVDLHSYRWITFSSEKCNYLQVARRLLQYHLAADVFSQAKYNTTTRQKLVTHSKRHINILSCFMLHSDTLDILLMAT
jgi:hypothetical protein